MMTPGSAPSTPASQVPAVLDTTPLVYSLVSSPKYQTLPAVSWAYQSDVRSSSAPDTMSRTTIVRTPRMSLVSLVTVSSIRSGSPSRLPSYTITVPGTSGKYLLVILSVNWAGSTLGE